MASVRCGNWHNTLFALALVALAALASAGSPAPCKLNTEVQLSALAGRPCGTYIDTADDATGPIDAVYVYASTKCITGVDVTYLSVGSGSVMRRIGRTVGTQKAILPGRSGITSLEYRASSKCIEFLALYSNIDYKIEAGRVDSNARLVQVSAPRGTSLQSLRGFFSTNCTGPALQFVWSSKPPDELTGGSTDTGNCANTGNKGCIVGFSSFGTTTAAMAQRRGLVISANASSTPLFQQHGWLRKLCAFPDPANRTISGLTFQHGEGPEQRQGVTSGTPSCLQLEADERATALSVRAGQMVSELVASTNKRPWPRRVGAENATVPDVYGAPPALGVYVGALTVTTGYPAAAGPAGDQLIGLQVHWAKEC